MKTDNIIYINQKKTSDSFDWNNQNPFTIPISLESLQCKALIQKNPNQVTHIHDKFNRRA